MRRAGMVAEALSGHEGTMAQTAVRYSLTNPGVSGVLVGFKVLSYVDEALAAIDMGPLADDTMTKLDKLYESDFGDI
tara:strand:- start:4672 stop:4902 length:231 start_codon:yes stop_codon:yes gene_type:complete